MPRILSYMIYNTQPLGIRGDGRVGLQWPDGDLSVTDVNRVIDELQVVVQVMKNTDNIDPIRSKQVDLDDGSY